MRSAGRSDRSRKNTPGPLLESTCPTMMAEPMAPGRGLLVYQPATLGLAGTARALLPVRPSLLTRARTPIAGIITAIGRGTRWSAQGLGSPAARPDGMPRRVTGPAR